MNDEVRGVSSPISHKSNKNLKKKFNITRSILESATEHSIIATDLDGVILTWNEGARRIFGYEPGEVLSSQKIFLLQDTADLESIKLEKIFDEVRNQGLWFGELNCVKKDGSRLAPLFTITLRMDSSGKPTGYTFIARDLPELQNEIQSIKQSEEYNRSLIESSLDVLIATDTLGIINDVNQKACDITEFSREELIGAPFKNFFTNPKHAEDAIRKVLSENRITNYELIVKSRTGILTPVSFNSTTLRLKNGELKGIFATAHDITEQRRLEEKALAQNIALKEATDFFHDLLESSTTNSIIALDLEGNIIAWNEGARRNYNYTADEMIGKKNASILHVPEDIKSGRAQEILDLALKTGNAEGEFERLRKNGERFYASVAVTLRLDAEKKPVGYVLISKDITDLKQQRQALEEQLNNNLSLLESSVDVFMITDVIGIITDVNKQMCIVTDRTREELIGTPFSANFTDPKRAEDCIRSVLASEKVINYDLTIKAKDGKETFVSCNATTFRDTRGNLSGVFTVARDVTEQKRLEEQIRKQNSELQDKTSFLNDILESSTAYSIIAEDLDGKILAWNEGARLNYGYTAEEMIGKQNTRVLHAPEDIKSGRLQAVLDAALSTGKEEGVLESVRKNGERFPASLALTLRRDKLGKPVGYVLISKDISEQNRQAGLRTKNVELAEQNRLLQEATLIKSEFLANMSHELRTPLNAIIGFTELMHLGKVGPVSPEHKEYLGDILTSSRHLLQLINDILDLAKVESGKMEFHPEKVDFDKVIGEVCDILRTLIAKNKITVSIKVDPKVASATLDPAKFKQILYNYISNALKFTNEGGTVEIRVVPEGRKNFRLEVEDNGIGISKKDIPKLFSEFQQLNATAAKKYQGTGLGLALTLRIVEAQGGEVGVSSTPGKGSTFFVTLPLVPHKIEKEKARNPVVTTATQLVEKNAPKILIVEDDKKESALIAKTLTTAGYAIETAFTGAKAIELCRVEHFDAITLDLLLPDMNGWNILRSIRNDGINQETPAIVVTVIPQKSASFGCKVQNFLLKPTQSEDILTALKQAGVLPEESKSVLFVDDDPKFLKLVQQYLKDSNLKLFFETDPEHGLEIAEKTTPDVIVLDLLMPNVGGLEFLRRLRSTEKGKNTPVIICTNQDLSDADKARIKVSVDTVIQKGGGAMEHLITELKHIAPIPAKKT
ncbi:MAG TPA: PAS domain S-box protein [Alphaproteobacteria bacterium]|nr:PAS domain S-box protein [Alphaproteobacteria bacterium]